MVAGLRNRWVRTGIYVWAQIWTTCVFYNWQHLSLVFFKSGSYAWLCNNPGDTPCDEQYTAVQTMFTVYVCGGAATAFISGFVYDKIGPLYTCAIGQSLYFIGWIVLLYSSRTFQLYIPASFFLGFSVLLIGFPSLVCREFFPSRPGLAISVIVGAQTLSTLVPLILYNIWERHPNLSYSAIMWGYLLIMVAPAGVLNVLALPLRHTSDSNEHNEHKDDKDTLVYPEPSSHSEVINDNPDVTGQATAAASSGSLMGEICSLNYIVFTLWFILAVLQISYYPTLVLYHQGEAVSNFLGNITPGQVIPCLAFGLLVDYTGPLLVSAIIVISNALTYLFALLGYTWCLYAGTIFYVLSLSSTYTVPNVFVDVLFNQRNFGTLVGLMSTLSGLIVLINIPIQNTAIAHRKYRPSIIAYLATTLGSLTMVFILYAWQKASLKKKNEIPSKQPMATEEPTVPLV